MRASGRGRRNLRAELDNVADMAGLATRATGKAKETEPSAGRATRTGLRQNGQTPDMRTAKGKAMAKSQESVSPVGRSTANTTPGFSTPRAQSSQGQGRASRTGLRQDGCTPDMRTLKGRAIATGRRDLLREMELAADDQATDGGKKAATQRATTPGRAAQSGRRLDGEPDRRTTIGKGLDVGRASAASTPSRTKQVGSMGGGATPGRAALTGLRLDSRPDMRTTKGRAMAASMPRASSSLPAPKTGGDRAGTSHANINAFAYDDAGPLAGFTGSANYAWNGNTSGHMTVAGLPDMRYSENRA